MNGGLDPPHLQLIPNTYVAGIIPFDALIATFTSEK